LTPRRIRAHELAHHLQLVAVDIDLVGSLGEGEEEQQQRQRMHWEHGWCVFGLFGWLRGGVVLAIAL